MPKVANKMMGFLSANKDKPPALVVEQKAIEPQPTETPKRRVGRPKKEIKADVQPTTIRLDTDDHLAVRTLALRDRMAMNELIFTALKEYCSKRGVKLHGAPK